MAAVAILDVTTMLPFHYYLGNLARWESQVTLLLNNPNVFENSYIQL
jgi:hypothetical protein